MCVWGGAIWLDFSLTSSYQQSPTSGAIYYDSSRERAAHTLFQTLPIIYPIKNVKLVTN